MYDFRELLDKNLLKVEIYCIEGNYTTIYLILFTFPRAISWESALFLVQIVRLNLYENDDCWTVPDTGGTGCVARWQHSGG